MQSSPLLATRSVGYLPLVAVLRGCGWTMAIAGLGLMAAYGTRFLGAEGQLQWSIPQRRGVAQALGVLLRMGVLQLTVAIVLEKVEPAWQRWIAPLLVAGSVSYLLGASALVGSGAPHEFCLAGSSLNLAGVALALTRLMRKKSDGQWQILAAVIAFGMLLDVVMAGLYVFPHLLPSAIDTEVDVRWRMLRLGRVAAVALPALALLYPAEESSSWHRLARWAMLLGAVAMPTVLTAASFGSLGWKYLLPLPAGAVLFGVVVACTHSRRWERRGWLLIGVSIAAGLGMGLYAFDGPLPAPAILGSYNQWERSLLRIAHGYTIVIGVLLLMFTRQLQSRCLSARC